MKNDFDEVSDPIIIQQIIWKNKYGPGAMDERFWEHPWHISSPIQKKKAINKY